MGPGYRTGAQLSTTNATAVTRQVGQSQLGTQAVGHDGGSATVRGCLMWRRAPEQFEAEGHQDGQGVDESVVKERRGTQKEAKGEEDETKVVVSSAVWARTLCYFGPMTPSPCTSTLPTDIAELALFNNVHLARRLRHKHWHGAPPSFFASFIYRCVLARATARSYPSRC
jgi:hypothetical protein